MIIIKRNNSNIKRDFFSRSDKEELGRNEHRLEHQANGSQIAEIVPSPQIEHVQQNIEFRFGWPLARIVMIAFVMVYTWYFSLAISHKIGITERGDIELTSFRRIVRVNAEVIGMAEGVFLIEPLAQDRT